MNRKIVLLTAAAALTVAVAACGSHGAPAATQAATTAAATPSPTPDPAASVLYQALSAASSDVSSDPAALATYANGVCNSLGKITLVGLQAGQDAYRLAISTYEQKGYTALQARAVINAVIYGYCPQWDQLTNTPGS